MWTMQNVCVKRTQQFFMFASNTMGGSSEPPEPPVYGLAVCHCMSHIHLPLCSLSPHGTFQVVSEQFESAS